ncbi:hypothetical protein ONS95_011466 [Cadophora gregata]|uniref:uncharacterized protein n=1 Tax=Cadophora gregata TaxID=51156 RepID=UPI0026DB81C9|nr:uncharacterized protein ONS95_011466 [Cadophora gregata]KAK0120053.1 hypothetical protein ONS95_011466 [Cadophora gregata]KAK0121086.1 hypothetical protein ONS96_011268 [Cadophora gregata f. sp. sojae]
MIPTTFFTALVALVATTQAHMEMKWPPALSGRYNGFTIKQDNNNHAPLSPDGSNFPCRGHLSDLGTPAGKSVVTWNAGSEYSFTIVGAIEAPNAPAFHNGGSCQAALSYDSGKTWKVIHSYQGACPTSTGGQFKFNVPSDAKDGAAVFGWLWWNHTGNREMYMNCASVTIASGSGPAPAIPFEKRPDIFRANIGNGCTTADETDVFFPNPGPDVTTVGTKKGNTFSGECSSEAPAGPVDAAGSADPASSSGAPPSSVQSPAPTAAPAKGAGADSAADGGIFTTTVTIAVVASSLDPTSGPSNLPSSSAFSASSKLPSTVPSSIPSGMPSGNPSSSAFTVSTNGECGGTTTCLGSVFGDCCSKWGWCGSTADYCGAGCTSDFGKCEAVAGRSAAIRGRHVRL